MLVVNFFKAIIKGFYFICSILSRGFYFYPKQLFRFLKRIFKTDKLNKIIVHFEERQDQPEFFLLVILCFVAIILVYKVYYVKPQDIIKNELNVNITDTDDSENDDDIDEIDNDVSDGDETVNNDKIPSNNVGTSEKFETNLFRKFAKTKLNDVNFSSLRKSNADTVLWISVDGTNINYPIVQTSNNEYYLDHSYDKSYKKSGWTFLDSRNNKNMSNRNTIFYGHNLLNKTAFGSISKVFESDWANNSNHSIIVLDDDTQYIYTIFSAYYIEPETMYLQTVFSTDEEYSKFLNVISSRNSINIDTSVSVDDLIITLSTCTEDNLGRKVVHAKLVSKTKRSS